VILILLMINSAGSNRTCLLALKMTVT